jgi:hypothetical protein
MRRNFICKATGDQCTDGRCTIKICCELERVRVEETQERIARRQQAYANEYWRNPEVRERERQCSLQEEIAEIERPIQRQNSN